MIPASEAPEEREVRALVGWTLAACGTERLCIRYGWRCSSSRETPEGVGGGWGVRVTRPEDPDEGVEQFSGGSTKRPCARSPQGEVCGRLDLSQTFGLRIRTN